MSVCLNLARTQMAVKIEAVEGTAETLTNAEAKIKVRNLKLWDPAGNFEADESVSASLSPWSGTYSGPFVGNMSGQLELVGSGTKDTEAAWLTLCKGMGVNVAVNAGTSVVLSPIETQGNTLTIGCFVDGTYFQGRGARGDGSFTFTSGKKGLLDFNFQGVWQEMTDVALLSAPSYETTVPPTWMGAALTLSSYAIKCQTIKFSLGNKLEPIDDPSATAGVHSIALVGKRHYTVTADPMRVTAATKNWRTIMTANTLSALAFNLGSATGNRWAWSWPKLQIKNITSGARGDMAVDEIEMEAIRNSDTGGDEFSATHT